jgi:hypothetical protein
MKKIAALLMLLLLPSCDKLSPELEGSHDYEDKPFSITVYVYDSKAELTAAAKELGVPEEAEGFALWSLTAKDRSVMTGCSVHVVKPKGVRDHSQMTTWGHELVHCVYGSYHKEGER